jgi:hypothetical protein
VSPDSGTPALAPRAARGRITRATWHTIGLIAAALLAYAVWRGYQNPDLLLDLSTLRLCQWGQSNLAT